MNKLIKTGNVVIVYLDDGRTFSKVGVTTGEFIDISDNLNDNDYILKFFNPQYKEELEKLENYNLLVSEIDNVPFLFYNKEEQSVYWQEVSPLSMPEDFTHAVIDAYRKGDNKALHGYKNFWILLSLNPSDDCRKNLWWFLHKHGLQVSSSGFFVAYRNVDRTNKVDDEDNPIYTDHHTHTFEISIGHTVSMPREEVDCNVEYCCSRGLHLGGAKWLEEYYYGNTGLVCLVNPVNVCALPRVDNYGKMRVCEYIPIDYAKYDGSGHIIPYDVEQGFECKYAAQAIYEGIISIEKDKYTIKAPEVKGLDSNQISENLLNLAKECITNKSYNVIND